MAATATRPQTAETPSRRSILALLAGVAVAAHPASSKARRQRHKRRKRKHKGKGNGVPQPAERLDAICDAPNRDSGRTILVDGRLAQTFTAQATGDLIRADLLISKRGNTFGDYVLQLNLNGANGRPANVILATSVVPDASVPEGTSTVTFTFTSPARITAAQELALVLSRPGATEFSWLGNGVDACAGVSAFSPDFTSAFVVGDGANIDLHFKTFVRS